MSVHASVVLPPPARLREWQPTLPSGSLRAMWLHWTAGDYHTVSSHYHFCVSGPHDILVHATHDLRANMRDLRPLPHALYAAHTAGRNSFAIGLALCGMADATPGDFGAYPLTEPLIAGLCEVAARLAVAYNIPLDAIRTHAEAAVEERYFGAGDDERWDIARLRASSAPLREEEAQIVGDALRSRIAMRLAERREA